MQPGVRDDEVVEYLPPLRVAPPRPRVPGGTEFYGAVPKHSATFAWSELCATPSPEDALAPVPQIPMKTWYNSYGYIPEESQEDRHFLGRFTGGPNDEWIDRVKAQRLVKAMDDQRQRQMREDMEREMVMAGMRSMRAEGALQAGGGSDMGGSDMGHGVHRTHYTDAYSGEKLIACKGRLQTREEVLAEYHIRGQVLGGDDEPFFDFDNLRFSWPFARPERNKPVSQHTFDWFDRRNMYIARDSSCEIVDMPSIYVERQELDRWWHGEPQRREAPRPMPQPGVQQVLL